MALLFSYIPPHVKTVLRQPRLLLGNRVSESRREFGHCGDLGDIIYALPTIRAAGGGTLYLSRSPITTHEMTYRWTKLIRPLLIQQSYIDDVIWWHDDSKVTELNNFREHFQPGRNLVEMHLATHGFGPDHAEKAWLQVRPKKSRPVIMGRSSRYQNPEFPWKRAWELYASRAYFIGLREEHAAFCRQVGPVEYRPTQNLLEAAQLIAGSKLYIGNQSVLFAIAEGLKATAVLEVSPGFANCSFHRPNLTLGFDERVDLPIIQ
jgi:hypothetical protein